MYGENYAHIIHIATRVALGHGLNLDDVRTINRDSLMAFTFPSDYVEDVDPIGPGHVVDEGMEGIGDHFGEIIADLERHGMDHDQILTDFLLCLSIRPPILPDH